MASPWIVRLVEALARRVGLVTARPDLSDAAVPDPLEEQIDALAQAERDAAARKHRRRARQWEARCDRAGDFHEESEEVHIMGEATPAVERWRTYPPAPAGWFDRPPR